MAPYLLLMLLAASTQKCWTKRQKCCTRNTGWEGRNAVLEILDEKAEMLYQKRKDAEYKQPAYQKSTDARV